MTWTGTALPLRLTANRKERQKKKERKNAGETRRFVFLFAATRSDENTDGPHMPSNSHVMNM